MRRWCFMVLLFSLCSAFIVCVARAEECSTAIISGAASSDGRPILWKNRDTDHLLNKVVFVPETPHSYIGVVDADDASGRRVYVGLNDAGFAIMNTVAYNLPLASGEAADFEGAIMADALRLCETVDDFERYVEANIGRSLGSQANFGVIDASGGAALFEVHNRGYQRFDAREAPEKYVLVTNFSRSGAADKGRGYVRFDRLRALFAEDDDGKFSFDQILETFARDLQNPFLPALEPAERTRLSGDAPRFVHTQQTINRASTAAAVVICGAARGAKPENAVLWIILGEPVCGIAVPLWVEAREIPGELSAGDVAPINKESMRLKSLLRPHTDDERIEYADLARLDNKEGTGWLPVLLAKEREIIERTARFLASSPDGAAKARFQKTVAAEALETLRGIR